MLRCFWRIFWYKKRQQLQSKIDKMSDRMATRHAICALADAGKSNKEIVGTLNVAKTTVIQTLKKQAAGGLDHDTSSRKKTVLTPRVAAGLKRRIKAAPTKSLRRVAKEAGLKPGVVWKLVRDCLLYTSPSPRD